MSPRYCKNPDVVRVDMPRVGEGVLLDRDDRTERVSPEGSWEEES